MKSLWQASLATLSLVVSASSALAAEDCAHPYKKVWPYQLPLGGDKASLLFQSDTRVNYDCSSFLAQTDATATLGFMELNLDVLNAQASLKAPDKGDAGASARLMVLGYEVGQEQIDLSEVVELELHPPVDLDISDEIIVPVGPLAVPVKYGVEGEVALGIRGGVQGIGTEVRLVPSVDSRAYAQAGLDVGYAKAIAKGDMILLRDRLESRIRVGIDDVEKLYLRFNVDARNKVRALDGSVQLQAQAKLGKFEPSYQTELFQWKAVEREDLFLQFSDRIPLN